MPTTESLTTLRLGLALAGSLLTACTRANGDGTVSTADARADSAAAAGAAIASAPSSSAERLTLQDGTVLLVAADTVTFIRVLPPPGPARDTLVVLVHGDSVVRLRPAPAGRIASPTAAQMRDLLRHARIAERLPSGAPPAAPEASPVP